eukprot:937627-Prymnesium_polylepis.1
MWPAAPSLRRLAAPSLRRLAAPSLRRLAAPSRRRLAAPSIRPSPPSGSVAAASAGSTRLSAPSASHALRRRATFARSTAALVGGAIVAAT